MRTHNNNTANECRTKTAALPCHPDGETLVPCVEERHGGHRDGVKTTNASCFSEGRRWRLRFPSTCSHNCFVHLRCRWMWWEMSYRDFLAAAWQTNRVSILNLHIIRLLSPWHPFRHFILHGWSFHLAWHWPCLCFPPPPQLLPSSGAAEVDLSDT